MFSEPIVCHTAPVCNTDSHVLSFTLMALRHYSLYVQDPGGHVGIFH